MSLVIRFYILHSWPFLGELLKNHKGTYKNGNPIFNTTANAQFFYLPFKTTCCERHWLVTSWETKSAICVHMPLRTTAWAFDWHSRREAAEKTPFQCLIHFHGLLQITRHLLICLVCTIPLNIIFVECCISYHFIIILITVLSSLSSLHNSCTWLISSRRAVSLSFLTCFCNNCMTHAQMIYL